MSVSPALRRCRQALLLGLVLAAVPSTAWASGTVSGQVTNADGSPASSALVTLVGGPSGGGVSDYSALTTSDGSYSVQSLPAGEYKACFSSSSSGGAAIYYSNATSYSDATEISVSDGTATGDVNQALPGTGSLSGKVMSSTGSALAGISVTVEQAPCDPYVPAIGGDNKSAVASTTTSSDGSYSVSQLPAGTYLVRFSDPSNTYATQYYDQETSSDKADSVTVIASGMTSGIDGTLEKAGTISGTVTGPRGTTGIEVTLLGLSPGTSAPNPQLLRADSPGFSFGDLVPGTYELEFSDNNWTYPTQYYSGVESQSQATQLILQPGESITDLTEALLPGGTISGRITDEQGNPISGATVSAAPDLVDPPYAPDADPPGQAVTGTDGTYTMSGLPDGNLYVMVTAGSPFADQVYPGVTGYPDAEPIVVTNGSSTSNVDLSLPVGGTVTGSVSPLGTTITFFVWEHGSFQQTRTIWGYSSPYSWLLAPGTYIARFMRDGYETQWSGGTSTESQATPFTVTADATTHAPGIALEPDGYAAPLGGLPAGAGVATPSGAGAPSVITPSVAQAVPVVSTSRITLNNRDTGLVRLRCVSRSPCTGIAQLVVSVRLHAQSDSRDRPHYKDEVIASSRYRLAAGHTSRLKLVLNRTGRRLLAATGNLKAVLVLKNPEILKRLPIRLQARPRRVP